MNDTSGLSAGDLKVLRGLGEWQSKAAETSGNAEKVQAWIDHDSGERASRVMVIAETWYTNDQRRPVMDSDLRCSDPWARDRERWLRQRKYEVETLRDDHMVQAWAEYAPIVHVSDYGIPSSRHHKAGADGLAFNYQPQLTNLDDSDFARIHPRTFLCDTDAEDRERERLEAVFKGILPVRRRNQSWQISFPITSTCLEFVGLDGFMLLMCMNPDGLHKLMAFIRDDNLALLRFYEENNLLELNNESDYVGSGCMCYTKNLPAPDFGGAVRPRDLWYFCESQESVGISPEQYGEFVFPYLRDIAKNFGRVYYGCCEGVDPVIPYLKTMPNLKRVSVSCWADEEVVGAFCREQGIVYSRKPRPTLFMGERFDEASMRAHLERTVEYAEGAILEFVLRDVCVTENEPERFARFVELAREAGSRHRN